MSDILAVSHLGVHLDGPDGRRLVDDVSFDLADGQRLGVIGESGSGKSLTALAILGLLGHPLRATGSIRLAVGDDTVDTVSARQRRLDAVRGSVVGAVFQEPLASLDPLMRIGAQLAWPLRHHRGLRGDTLRAAVLDALAEVQLAEPERIARSLIHEVSGGQRQRVAIALALAARPRLLIADEPTTALDVTVQAGVLELLQSAVRERGMSLVFISHDLPVVAGIADRVLVMRNGRVVEVGETRQILGAPREDYTRTLVGASRALDDLLPSDPLEGDRA
ncbi:peptide/nickel transport system ATP-binding protein [Labedella gwakjiensis]|uniref:ABC transporter ATP-binding protein n=1 Tax=Labedella gwakjiensis TaxID=390269 RepID=A0A2P8GZ14_9MICO|nr:ABC transporter ATP-binding protein [Labedella gwakjiensis]PSL39206.1 peptide/nickel transport system ATP-binding protein [Labedella gwakjiensis]RUQ86364.1 ABC transporter ATP-binding protein [Labedella gwakjiensis]